MADNKEEVMEQISKYETRLKRIKTLAQKTRDAKITGVSKVATLKQNEQNLITKITEAGLEPDKLKVYIIESQKKLNSVLTKLEGNLPDENGNIANKPLANNVIENAENIDIPDVSVTIPKGTKTDDEILKDVKDIDIDDLV